MTNLGTVKILRASKAEEAVAQIVELTPAMARTRIDQQWWSYPELEIVSRESDQHWNWESVVLQEGKGLLIQCVGVLSQEDYLEGALIYRLDAKSRLEVGKGCLYISRLATAPRNRKWICSTQIYQRVGLVLLHWAIEQSYLNALGGRISLQSLPTLKTCEFYEDNGFVRTDLSQSNQGLIDYELPTSAAQRWLNLAKEA